MQKLHPELVQFVRYETHSGVPVLQHPFIVTLYSEHADDHYNKVYKAKKSKAAKAKAQKNYQQFISLHERTYRLTAFAAVEADLTDVQYWTLLSDIWINSDNIWQELATWCSLMRSDRPMRDHFMNEDERSLFQALPDSFTVYRGYQPGTNRHGLAFTLSRKVAVWFTKRCRDHGKVYTKRILKGDVFAYLTRRNQAEIILLPKIFKG